MQSFCSIVSVFVCQCYYIGVTVQAGGVQSYSSVVWRDLCQEKNQVNCVFISYVTLWPCAVTNEIIFLSVKPILILDTYTCPTLLPNECSLHMGCFVQVFSSILS